MNRYLTSKIEKQSNSRKRKLSTTIFPSMPTTAQDVYIQITTTERLDTLAYQFYDDSTAWPVIAAANGLAKGSLLVKPGTTLRIPSKRNFNDVIEQLNIKR
jgi:prophage DNA circulation protein